MFQNLIPSHRSNNNINKVLIQLGLRPFNWKELKLSNIPPISDAVREANYPHDESFGSFVRGRLSESQLKNYDSKSFECDSIRYQPENRHIQVSSPGTFKDPNAYDDVLEYINRTGYAEFVDTKKPTDWVSFSESAVWLPGDNCYISVDRYMFAPGLRDWPIISLCRMQAFDANWNEIVGKRIRYVDINETQVSDALHDYIEGDEWVKDSALDKISMRLPRFLNVPIQEVEGRDKVFLGPEDSKISLRKNKLLDDEPIITFNMLTSSKDRLMHAAFPLRAPVKGDEVIMTALKYSGSRNGDDDIVEKNWTPFFDANDGDYNGDSLGKAHILYSLSEMEVLECNLDTGACELDNPKKVKEPKKFEPQIKDIYLRGGSNIITMPQPLKDQIWGTSSNPDDDLWFGVAKTHDAACSCGGHTYRPIMFIMDRKNGTYELEVMSIISELGIKISAWNGGDIEHCDGAKNVLTPNSIPFWGIEKTENGFSDYLGLTLSIADSEDIRVFIKGIANYVADIYKENSIEQANDTMPSERSQIVKLCALQASNEHCEEYAKLHPNTEDS